VLALDRGRARSIADAHARSRTRTLDPRSRDRARSIAPRDPARACTRSIALADREMDRTQPSADAAPRGIPRAGTPRMLNTVKNAMCTIGDTTGEYAKRFGSGTADLANDLAKKIGPKRALLGIAVLGVVVGGSIFLVRYLRARKEDLPFEGTDEQFAGKKVKRNAKRGTEAHYSH